MTNPQHGPGPVTVFFGWLLMGIGGLIAVTAGSCSLVFILAVLGSGDSLGGLAEALGITLMIGGVPFAVGAALFVVGRKISRRRLTKAD